MVAPAIPDTKLVIMSAASFGGNINTLTNTTKMIDAMM